MKKLIFMAFLAAALTFLFFYFLSAPEAGPIPESSSSEFVVETAGTPLPPPDTKAVAGTSVLTTLPSGRTIDLYHFGADTTDILIVGSIHGGYEISAKVMVDAMIKAFQDGRLAMPPGKGISLIPCMNPDGCAQKTGEYQGRFNANSVDLNRNWSFGWKQKAFLNNIPVNPGTGPFSEIETQIIRDYILSVKPGLTVFYHCCVGSGYVYLNNRAEQEKTFQPYLDATGFGFDPNKNFVGGDAIEYMGTPEVNLVGVEVEFPGGERLIPNSKLHLQVWNTFLQSFK